MVMCLHVIRLETVLLFGVYAIDTGIQWFTRHIPRSWKRWLENNDRRLHRGAYQ